MTVLSDRYAVAETVSEGWLDALRMVRGESSKKLVHAVIRITDPCSEDPTIRRAADELIAAVNARKSRDRLWDIDSTRNTIFPAAWASRYPEPSDLSDYYRSRYKELRSFRNDNKYGTYFGRIVAYPRGPKKHADLSDQLSELVRKIREEFSSSSRKSSRYEVSVFSERHDTNTMSFPCLAHLSFHIHDGRVHLQAVYRNEVIVGRAYGNYLGLAQLLEYVAAACPPLEVGELLMCINHAELDSVVHLSEVDTLLKRFE